MKNFLTNITVKQMFVLASSLAVVSIVLGLWANAARLTAKEIEADARNHQQVPTEWLVVQDINGADAALLFYSPARDGYITSIYTNSGLGLKNYRFNYTRNADELVDGIAAFPVGSGVAYLSMNSIEAAQIELPDGEVIPLDPEKPFAKLLPAGEDIRFYDKNGNELGPVFYAEP